MDKDELVSLAKEILDKVMKFSDGGAVAVWGTISHQLRFSRNKIDIAKTWHETNIAILMEKEKKVNITSISLPATKNIDKILEAAKLALERSQPRPIYAELPKPEEKYREIPNKVSKDVIEEPGKMADIAKRVIDIALSEGAKRVAGAIRGNYYQLALATSKDVLATDEWTNTYIDVRAFVNGEETGHSSQLARGFYLLNPDKVGSEAAQIAKLNRNAKILDAGRYDTLITPNAVAAIMNLVAGSASAFSVLMGTSFFTKRLGQQIGSEKITVIDDPHGEYARDPRSFDDEGVPTRVNTIIENGWLKTYLHNRFTAAAFQTTHTGNAGWISPHAWHIRVKEGDATREEMISELGRGFILNNVTYIRFQNYLNGDFSGIIRDGLFYVENGEIKYAVKGLRFSDNALRILKEIKLVGKDVENIFHWWLEYDVSVTTPSILVKECGYTKAHGL